MKLMKPITYVNASGQPVNPDHLPRAVKLKAPPLKRVENAENAKKHFGFEVVGVSQARVDEAAAQHALTIELADPKQRVGMPAFDADAWIAKARQKRAISRVFVIPESAEQAAGMLRAGGGVGIACRPLQS